MQADRDSTPSPEVLSSLIGYIYDATLDRSLWPDVLKKIAIFVHGTAAAVFWDDVANGSGDVYFEDGGIASLYRDLYFERYFKLNPTATPRMFVPVGEPVATNDLVPYEEFLRTRFYQEWARPQGLVDFVSITLEKTTTKSAMVGVFRHEQQGLVDDEMRRRMRILGPHIRRAVLISKVIDVKRNDARNLAEALDGMRIAIFLVDQEGRIIHANAAGNALLSQSDVLRAVSGKVVTFAPETNEMLREAFLAASLGEAAIGGKGISIPLVSKTGEHHAAHVLPLTSGARHKAIAGRAAAAAVFVHKSTLEHPSSPELIAKAFGLTLAELRVLLAIVEIGGVPQVAEVLGIGATTVKTHLGRIYRKTGSTRQADLVKLVAGFSNPAVG
jgi:DNA-binding CsgD family transcriptional regulator/PAS domain-containing protein